MKRADSKESSPEDLTKNRAPAAVELNMPRSNEPSNAGSDPISMGRRLDVDAVLERSVRKVVTE